MTVGGTMVTTVRSVLAATSLQPSGSLRSETCTESAKSRPVRSIVIDSGMLSAGASTSTVCSTRLTVPPFLRPGEASRFCDVHRNADAHAGARGQPQEVDMHRPVGDDVELVVAREHALLAAVHFELEDGGQEMPGVNELVDVLEVDRDRFGLHAAAIDDGGNAAFATNGAGGPLAYPAARHGRELLDRCHDDVLIELRRASASRGVGDGAKGRLIGEERVRGKRGGELPSNRARLAQFPTSPANMPSFVEDLADHGCESICGQRFLDQVNPWIESTLMDDRVARISRHEQDLEVRLAPLRFLCEFPT